MRIAQHSFNTLTALPPTHAIGAFSPGQPKPVIQSFALFGNNPNINDPFKIQPREKTHTNPAVDTLRLGISLVALLAMGPLIGLSLLSMLSIPALIFGLAIPTAIEWVTKSNHKPLKTVREGSTSLAQRTIDFIAKRKWLVYWFKPRSMSATQWRENQYRAWSPERLQHEATWRAERKGGRGAYSFRGFRSNLTHTYKYAYNQLGKSIPGAAGVALLSSLYPTFRMLRLGNSVENMTGPLKMIKEGQVIPGIRALMIRGGKNLINPFFWRQILIGYSIGGVGEIITSVLLASMFRTTPKQVLPPESARNLGIA